MAINPSNTILKTNLSTDHNSFFITNGGNLNDYVKFDANAVQGLKTIIMPNNNVNLGNIASSVSLSTIAQGTGNASLTTTGDISIKSLANTNNNIRGTLIEGSRMFNVEQSLNTTQSNVTFTFTTSSTPSVYLIEAKLSFNSATSSDCGARVGKAMFHKTSASMGNPVFSIDTFGNPESTIVFGSNGPNTITVQMGVASPATVSNNTDINGSIIINTEDTDIKITSIA